MTRDEYLAALSTLAQRFEHSTDDPTSYSFQVPPTGDDLPPEPREVSVALHEDRAIVVVYSIIRPWEEDGSLAIPALRANFDSLAARVGLLGDLLVMDFRRALGHLGEEEFFEAVQEVATLSARFATDELTESGRDVDRVLRDDSLN